MTRNHTILLPIPKSYHGGGGDGGGGVGILRKDYGFSGNFISWFVSLFYPCHIFIDINVHLREFTAFVRSHRTKSEMIS